MGKTTKKDHKK